MHLVCVLSEPWPELEFVLTFELQVVQGLVLWLAT